MKWRPPSPRTQMIILAPVMIPLLIVSSPIIAVLAAATWVEWRIKVALPQGWSPWFAWRPIRINDMWDDASYGQWAWLETVERRYFGQMEYRLVGQGAESSAAESRGGGA